MHLQRHAPMDNVVRPEVATVLRRFAGDLDIAGPAWFRSYPDRGGPVHQQRREKLMRRASTCLALLGSLAVLGLPAAASAAPTRDLQSQGRADPEEPLGRRRQLPAHRQHPRRRAARRGARSRIHDRRLRLRRDAAEAPGGIPPLAAVNFYLPAGAKINAPASRRARNRCSKNAGPERLQQEVGRPARSATRSAKSTFGTERVPEEATLQAFFGPAAGSCSSYGSSPVSLEIRLATGTYVNTAKKATGSS